MHELSIAANILDATKEYQIERGLSNITAVGVRIGVLSDVVPDALEFGFEALTRDTEYESTRLDIERVEARGKCRQCQSEFTVEGLFFVCNQCESADVELVSGQELEIVYFDSDDDIPESAGRS